MLMLKLLVIALLTSTTFALPIYQDLFRRADTPNDNRTPANAGPTPVQDSHRRPMQAPQQGGRGVRAPLEQTRPAGWLPRSRPLTQVRPPERRHTTDPFASPSTSLMSGQESKGHPYRTADRMIQWQAGTQNTNPNTSSQPNQPIRRHTTGILSVAPQQDPPPMSPLPPSSPPMASLPRRPQRSNSGMQPPPMSQLPPSSPHMASLQPPTGQSSSVMQRPPVSQLPPSSPHMASLQPPTGQSSSGMQPPPMSQLPPSSPHMASLQPPNGQSSSVIQPQPLPPLHEIFPGMYANGVLGGKSGIARPSG